MSEDLFYWDGLFILKNEGLVTKAANAVINTLMLSLTYFVIDTSLTL